MALVLNNRGSVKREALRLLEAEQDDEFVNEIDLWFEQGLNDVYSYLRAWWAVRAAWFEVQEDGVIYLPPSYLEMMTVFPIGGGSSLTVITPDQAGIWFGRGGPPIGYLMEGFMLTLLPPQSQSFQARCTYYSKLEPLDSDNDTSSYVNRAGTALLYSTAAHGAAFRGDIDNAQIYRSAAVDRMDVINAESLAARSGAGVQVVRQR